MAQNYKEVTPNVETPEAKAVTQESLPPSGHLIATEKQALSVFFGKDIAVTEPPQELFQTLEKMSKLGITGFEPHFLPQVSLSQKDKLPGWKVKPGFWFWQHIKDRKVAKDAAVLRAGWYLVDGRGKPNYDNGQQRYEDDAWFQAAIHELRSSKRVKTIRDVVSDSRFGVSANEVEQVILPEFAKALNTTSLVRTSREIEFNILGNMHHPEWGDTNTRELMNDKFGDGRRLIGGVSGDGGLALVGYRWADDRFDDLAFRPLVEFSPKNSPQK